LIYNVLRCFEEMYELMRCWMFIVLIFFLFLGGYAQGSSPENSSGHQIVALAEKMISIVEEVEGFQCNTEIQYYREGKKYKVYRFAFYTNKSGEVRLRFLRPYPGVSVFYRKGDDKITVQPFRFLPIVKFRLSLTNPRVISPSGQRIDQGTMAYLIQFFYQNCELIRQRESQYSEKGNEIDCTYWARDYTGKGEDLNRYRLVVSKENWFPTRIERFDPEGGPIEGITFKEYEIGFTGE
jgi:outer membrane lipoprotein-sorting protein